MVALSLVEYYQRRPGESSIVNKAVLEYIQRFKKILMIRWQCKISKASNPALSTILCYFEHFYIVAPNVCSGKNLIMEIFHYI